MLRVALLELSGALSLARVSFQARSTSEALRYLNTAAKYQKDRAEAAVNAWNPLNHLPKSKLSVSDNSPFYSLRLKETVTEHYTIGRPIDVSQTGFVYAAHEKSTGLKCAIKSVNKRRQAASPKDVRREVHALHLLAGQPNIIKLMKVYEDEDSIHMITELCEGGNILDRMHSELKLSRNIGSLYERKVSEITELLLKALMQCHQAGVVHRDIKPENLLFVDSSDKSIRITNFSHCMALKPGVKLMDMVATPQYMAPEVIQFDGHGAECDVWSLGVVLYLVLSGSLPFNGQSVSELFHTICYNPLDLSDKSWSSISDKGKDFISRMLVKDPKERASITQLLEHPWLVDSKAAVGMAESSQSSPAKGDELTETVLGRMRKNAAVNRFKKSARRVLSQMLNEDEVKDLTKVFKSLDKDGDGTLSYSELEAGLKLIGIKEVEKELKVLLKTEDLDGDGKLDYQEFLMAAMHEIRLDKDEMMFNLFKHFDRDGDGYITLLEMTSALPVVQNGLDPGLDPIIPYQEFSQALKEMDIDKDGKVDYNEFCTFIRNRNM